MLHELQTANLTLSLQLMAGQEYQDNQQCFMQWVAALNLNFEVNKGMLATIQVELVSHSP